MAKVLSILVQHCTGEGNTVKFDGQSSFSLWKIDDGQGMHGTFQHNFDKEKSQKNYKPQGIHTQMSALVDIVLPLYTFTISGAL